MRVVEIVKGGDLTRNQRLEHLINSWPRRRPTARSGVLMPVSAAALSRAVRQIARQRCACSRGGALVRLGLAFGLAIGRVAAATSAVADLKPQTREEC